MKKLFITLLVLAMTSFMVASASADIVDQTVTGLINVSSVLTFNVDEASFTVSMADYESGWISTDPSNLTLNMTFGSPGMNSTIKTAITAGGFGPLCAAGGIRLLLDQTSDIGFMAGPVNLPRVASAADGVLIFDVATPVSMTGQIVQVEFDADLYRLHVTDFYTQKEISIQFQALVE